ncbi:MAG: CapA family protein [bacterium]|nr:CapA family protein [bacterium]
MEYPKRLHDNLAWRNDIMNNCLASPEHQLKIKTLFHKDILFAFNAFFFTLDVRKRPYHNQPFCTYEFQDQTILELQESIIRGKDYLIEKSRDMGCSWMVILTYLHFWLDPAGGGDFLLGSRIEDYVDKKGDMRALISKARYALYKLPVWLRPLGFNPKTHDNFMRLVNPETNSSITGESNNPNWSTGGRYLSGLMDELAKWEGSDKSAWTAAGDATPSRVALSTPFGAGGQYYDLAHGDQIKKRTLHWSLHPEKAAGLYCVWPKTEEMSETCDSDHWIGLRSPWYDMQCKRRRPLEIAQELDIDYIGAGNPVFDGKAGKRIGSLLRIDRAPLEAYVLVEPLFELEKAVIPEMGDEREGHFIIYEKPEPLASYITAVDVAEGKEDGDFSIVKVLRRETESVVATYFSRIDEVRLAGVVNTIVLHYTLNEKMHTWAVETVGPGLSTFNQLQEVYELPYAFLMPTYDTVKQSPSNRKGWWTSVSSKRALVGGITRWLLDGEGWCDKRCVKEMTTFVRDKMGKANAKSGCYDDEVMAFGIALQVNEMAPMEDNKLPVAMRQDGLPEAVFKPPEVKKATLIDHCIATIERNKEQSGYNSMVSNYDAFQDLEIWD